MAVVPTPHPVGRTYLWYVAEYFRQLKNRIRDVARQIDSIFIIGDHLSGPFYDWAWYVGVASDFLFQTDDFIRSLKGWLNGLYDGWNFVNLLYWASWHFREIKLNPINWVKYRLGEASYWLGWIVWNPQHFVKHFVVLLGYWVGRFINNPENAIYDIVRRMRGWLGWFLDNPRDWVIGLLRQVMSDFYNFLVSPVNYILGILRARIVDFDLLISYPQGWVIRQLLKLYPDFISFLRNPTDYLKVRIAQWFGLPPNFWHNPQLFLMTHILDGVERYLIHLVNRIVRLAVEVILRYI